MTYKELKADVKDKIKSIDTKSGYNSGNLAFHLYRIAFLRYHLEIKAKETNEGKYFELAALASIIEDDLIKYYNQNIITEKEIWQKSKS